MFKMEVAVLFLILNTFIGFGWSTPVSLNVNFARNNDDCIPTDADHVCKYNCSCYGVQAKCQLSDQSVQLVCDCSYFIEFNTSVNGNWGLWTDNGTCSKSCGAGTKTQIRQCDNPEPANGGSSCNGSSTQTVQCNTDLCPVKGNWGGWTDLSTCTKTCGNGTKTQTRLCNNPAPKNGGSNCSGSANQTVNCNTNVCPVNGNWGSWSDYSTCSQTCDSGTKTRTRTCNNPAPSNGGSTCPGSSTQSVSCNIVSCAVCALGSFTKSNGQKVCYFKIDSTNDWSRARDNCRSHGARLPEIRSEAENNIVKNLGLTYFIWLGLNDLAAEGNFVLDSDNSAMSYSNWYPGEPNDNAHKQNCVNMYSNPWLGKWNDNYCTGGSWTLDVICEFLY